MKSNVGGSNGLVTSYAFLKMYLLNRLKRKRKKTYKRVSGGQPTAWLGTMNKDFSGMDCHLNEAFEIAYDRDI